MKIQSILLLIVSIILVIVSSWNVSVLIRLSDASHQYSNDDQFDSACHVAKKYVETGKIVAIVILVISVLLMICSSVSIYRNNV